MIGAMEGMITSIQLWLNVNTSAISLRNASTLTGYPGICHLLLQKVWVSAGSSMEWGKKTWQMGSTHLTTDLVTEIQQV